MDTSHIEYMAPWFQYWNLLPSNVKQAKTHDIFKSEIREIEMPFCLCEKCLTLQNELKLKTHVLIEQMLHEIRSCK